MGYIRATECPLGCRLEEGWLRSLLNEIADGNPEFRGLGLSVFVERASSWHRDLLTLIREGALDE